MSSSVRRALTFCWLDIPHRGLPNRPCPPAEIDLCGGPRWCLRGSRTRRRDVRFGRAVVMATDRRPRSCNGRSAPRVSCTLPRVSSRPVAAPAHRDVFGQSSWHQRTARAAVPGPLFRAARLRDSWGQQRARAHARPPCQSRAWGSAQSAHPAPGPACAQAVAAKAGGPLAMHGLTAWHA